jgi:hypothetical protein
MTRFTRNLAGELFFCSYGNSLLFAALTIGPSITINGICDAFEKMLPLTRLYSLSCCSALLLRMSTTYGHVQLPHYQLRLLCEHSRLPIYFQLRSKLSMNAGYGCLQNLRPDFVHSLTWLCNIRITAIQISVVDFGQLVQRTEHLRCSKIRGSCDGSRGSVRFVKLIMNLNVHRLR